MDPKWQNTSSTNHLNKGREYRREVGNRLEDEALHEGKTLAKINALFLLDYLLVGVKSIKNAFDYQIILWFLNFKD
ncbi:hypothetical protein G9A89_003783 [Geosiphon pyriformis]|nr:hypothetical protein G9A89_003783 [Geosiphon pyriformis]